MKLEGKVALITGGSRGFGKGFAAEVLDNGGQVCLLDVLVADGLDTASEFNSTYGQGSALFIKCDVTNQQELKNTFEKTHEVFKHIDIVVNNAGIFGNWLNPGWEKVIDINLNAVVRGCIYAHDYMSTDKGGRGGLIVNIASVAGLMPATTEPVYAAAKHGVVGLSRSLAPTFEKVGIRVSCLCPAFTNTPMMDGIMNRGGDPVLEEIMRNIGVMEIPDVVRAFRNIVDNDDVTGGVIAVTTQGIDYRYPRNMKGKL